MLTQQPVDEIQGLYDGEPIRQTVSIQSGTINIGNAVSCDAIVEFEPLDGCTELGSSVRQGSGCETLIGCDINKGSAFLDCTKASSAGVPILKYNQRYTTPFTPDGSRAVIRVVVDASTAEAFFSKVEASFCKYNYSLLDAMGISLFANGRALAVVTIHKMRSVWNNRIP